MAVDDQKTDDTVAVPGALSTDIPPLVKPKRNKYVFGCAILASMTSILLGYDFGAMSVAMNLIKDDLDITHIKAIMWIFSVCSLFGSALAGITSDWIGRHFTIVLAAVIYFIGAIMTGLAQTYAFLMAGRSVAGVGVGYALMIGPVYTAEVSPASSRGFLTSFTEVFIKVGILLGIVSNFAFPGVREHLKWRLMLGVGAIPSVFLGLGVFLMPESPRWLVMQGRLGDAREVLFKTSDSKEEAELRLVDIKKAAGIPLDCTDDVVKVSKRSHEGTWKELLISPTPAVRRVLIAAIGIHFFQQASGIDAVVFYSLIIFQKAGITEESTLLGAIVVVGFVKIIFIFVATFFLDRVGRRPLLLSSVAGMIASLALLATGLTIVDHQDTQLMWAVVPCITVVLAYVAFFSIGMGPITWVYSSEIFPLRLRAQGCSLGVAVNRLTSGVITMTFLSLSKRITMGGALFLFAGITSVAWIFFYTFLPETQGLNLEDMGALFGKFEWKDSLRNNQSKEEGKDGELLLET